MKKIIDVAITKTTPQQKEELRGYDYSTLTAVNTCPKWGIIAYVHDKQIPNAGRQMALEAGQAAHEVYAAARLYQLAVYQGLEEHARVNGFRVFGEERYSEMWSKVDPIDDDETCKFNFCMSALDASGFYDDPRDKRRTKTNIEDACLAYLSRVDMKKMPVYVADNYDPTSFVGIEVPIDIVLTVIYEGGEEVCIRFIGRVDGVHTLKGKPIIVENKTTARIDDSWRTSFEVSVQPTGYMIGVSVELGLAKAISRGIVYGMQIPQPRATIIDLSGIVRIPLERELFTVQRWINWIVRTYELIQAEKDDPLNATMYSHSCNRYFSVCSFVPMCASPDEVAQDMFNELVPRGWNPLD